VENCVSDLRVILDPSVEERFVTEVLAEGGSVGIGTATRTLGKDPTNMDSPYIKLLDSNLFVFNPLTYCIMVLLPLLANLVILCRLLLSQVEDPCTLEALKRIKSKTP
jgi:hypothetical protein